MAVAGGEVTITVGQVSRGCLWQVGSPGVCLDLDRVRYHLHRTTVRPLFQYNVVQHSVKLRVHHTSLIPGLETVILISWSFRTSLDIPRFLFN